MPLRAGYATVAHKTQGGSFGDSKDVEFMIAHVANHISMEKLSLGLIYTLFSRVEKDSDWALGEAIDADRITCGALCSWLATRVA